MWLFFSCDPGQIQYRATVPLCALAVNCLVKNFFFSYSLSGANVGRILAASHRDRGCADVAISPG